MVADEMMKAAVLLGYGGPEMLEVRSDVPIPSPGPDEALIAVAACGVNNTDVNTRVGWYSKSVTEATTDGGFDRSTPENATWAAGGIDFPRIQGADICGHVVSIGDQADPGLVGERVLVDPWVRDKEHPTDRSLARYLGSELDGGFAQYCAVPARNVHPIRSSFSDAELATFACSWSTALHMLERVELSENQTIVITGASGGVGTALVQLAVDRGARVIAVAGANKANAVAALGAHEAVPRGENTIEEARLRAGRPIDVVADVVGGPDMPGWLETLRPGGRFVTSGAIAGPIVELDLRTLYLNDLEVFGATVVPPGLFAMLVSHIESGRVLPVMAGTYPLEGIHDAQESFGAKSHVGSYVITI